VRGHKMIVLAVGQRAHQAYLSARAASRGKCSQTVTPGILLAIGLNSPRISGGASGFMSNMSRWLGAPGEENNNHRLGLRASFSSAAAAACRLSKSDKPKPSNPEYPTCN